MHSIISRTPTIAVLLIWFEVAINEEWAMLQCSLKIDRKMRLL
jgi:hypothetical protein